MLHTNLEQVLKQMLKGQLSYSDRQLIQQGKLKEVAERHLTYRKRLLWVQYTLTVAIALYPSLLQLIAVFLSRNPSELERYRLPGAELALLHLPMAIYHHFNLSRFETIYSLWAYSAEDEAGTTENPADEATAEHCLVNC